MTSYFTVLCVSIRLIDIVDSIGESRLIQFWGSLKILQVAENLAQLMYGVLMTGYMFRNAQYRLELQQSLEHVALPEPKERLVSSFFFFSL